jgi:hypothetical protein
MRNNSYGAEIRGARCTPLPRVIDRFTFQRKGAETRRRKEKAPFERENAAWEASLNADAVEVRAETDGVGVGVGS